MSLPRWRGPGHSAGAARLTELSRFGKTELLAAAQPGADDAAHVLTNVGSAIQLIVELAPSLPCRC